MPAIEARAEASSVPVPASASDAREQAKVAFKQAVADFAARRYRDALHGFQRAVRLLPNAELWFNIGRAHEELGEIEDAIAALRRYLHDSVEAPDRREVERRIASLEAALTAQNDRATHRLQVALLRIEAEPTGAQVLLDGSQLGAAPVDRWLALAPGAHRLHVALDGYVPAVARIDLDPGAVVVAQAGLVPARVAPTPRASRPWPWVALAVGAAALTASAALAVADVAAEDAPAGVEGGRDAMLAAGLTTCMLGALLWVIDGDHEAHAARP